MAEPVVLEFPFDSGAYEGSDSRWIPENVLAVAENVRLDLDGRLGVRPGYTALATSTYSASAMVAYDLANFNGRLVALGDQTGLGRPTDLFELVNTTPAVWRATSAEDDGFGSGPRIPRATSAREIGRISDSATDVRYVSTAAVSVSSKTFVLAVHQLQDETCRVHIFIADTDQSLIVVTRPLRRARAIAVGSTLWVIGQQTNNSAIVAHKFAPGTDETMTSVGTLIALGATIVDIAAAQTGASDFTVAYVPSGGASVEAVRFNSAGVAQSTFTAQAALVGAKACAVTGNAAGTLLSFAYMTQAASVGSYFLKTTNATGGGGVGPTALFAGATVTGWVRLAMTQLGSVISICGMRDNASTNDVATQLCTSQGTNGLATTIFLANAFLRSGPAGILNGSQTNWYFGCAETLAITGAEATNLLIEQASRLPQIYKDATIAGPHSGTDNSVGSSCFIGSKLYWGNTLQGIAPRDLDAFLNSGATGTVTELEMSDTGRRQMSQLGNELHIAGAIPLVYDGRALFEQGFAERPSIAVAQSAAGNLTLLGRYNVRAVWEMVDARGYTLRSQASDPIEITLLGANATITATVNTPHSLRNWPFNVTSAGVSVRVGIYRTIAGGANFFLDQFVNVSTASAYGDVVTATLNATDTSIRDNQVLYEQSQTPISHVSPPPHRFKCAARARELIGALPQEEGWTYSKLLFPSEPIEYPNQGRLGFSGRANQSITGVAAFEQAGVIFTASEIQQIFGRGPEHSGVGEFDDPMNVASPGGCSNGLSIVSTPIGIFFQMDDEKLMLLSRTQNGTAGDVSWAGQPVRQTLKAFPRITGAVHVRSQMLVAFACNNAAGTDSRILIFDLRRGQWFIDSVGAPISAISEFAGRLAYVSAGVVFLQDVAPGSGAMPTQRYGSGFIKITRTLGWGHIYKVGLLGTVLAACTVECFIDYDDGAGPQSLGSIAFVGTEGAREEFWSLNQQKTSRFSLTFVVSSAGSNTLGFRANSWAAKVEGSRSTARVGSTGAVA